MLPLSGTNPGTEMKRVLTEISTQKSDDLQLHLRDDDLPGETVRASARCFERAIVMPNLVPPLPISNWHSPTVIGSRQRSPQAAVLNRS